MKLRENLYKIIIIALLLGFWGYLLYPIVLENNIRPDFHEILAMGQSMAKLIKYSQVFLLALIGLLAALAVTKLSNLYFTRRWQTKERNRIAKQIKIYKQTHHYLSSFADLVSEPFDIVNLWNKARQ
ncbi:hypothetical protein HZC34_04135 [Candidatus Saganbacteria bacterium]|nr:hypothetical protein [Candidatus Saganbacteria bacterium]